MTDERPERQWRLERGQADRPGQIRHGGSAASRNETPNSDNSSSPDTRMVIQAKRLGNKSRLFANIALERVVEAYHTQRARVHRAYRECIRVSVGASLLARAASAV